ncbi:MAG: isoprenylcysteine carboxylmethyltransferase family protein [Methanospirillaceae archaeon]|nr:isoprenylcysteine carboxylmethyltransferase family protein [Methanospirillaceae archaeon]
MDDSTYKLILLILLLLFVAIRAPFVWSRTRTEKMVNKTTLTDRIVILLFTLGMAVVPLIYIITPFFDACSLGWPDVLRMSGIFLYLFSLLYLLFIHLTLGKNWSMHLALSREHKLITTGPYRYIRHPMYTAFCGMMVGQLFLTSNWFFGGFGLVTLLFLIGIRIPKEEHMMTEQFGDEYRVYSSQTGMLFPIIGKKK